MNENYRKNIPEHQDASFDASWVSLLIRCCHRPSFNVISARDLSSRITIVVFWLEGCVEVMGVAFVGPWTR
jgi:hypothetical protein